MILVALLFVLLFLPRGWGCLDTGHGEVHKKTAALERFVVVVSPTTAGCSLCVFVNTEKRSTGISMRALCGLVCLCLSMANEVQFGFGDLQVSPGAGWRLVTWNDLQPSQYKSQFIRQYNAKGLPLIKSFKSGNCCVSIKGGTSYYTSNAYAIISHLSSLNLSSGH